MSITSISNAYINTHLFRWRGAYFEVSWTWSSGTDAKKLYMIFMETTHTAERPFLLLIYMEALSLEKRNCTSLKERKIFKNEWKVTERLTSWGFWRPIRLCCCSYHEKTIQYKIPVAGPFTLQVGIRERQDIKAEMNSSQKKIKLTELWRYTIAPRNRYSKGVHFTGTFTSGIASCNLLTNMAHGKNTHTYEGLLFKTNFQLKNMGNS